MQTFSPASAYVDAYYLDMAEVFLRPAKRRGRTLMRIRAGQSVLDVGCGVGLDTLELAALVGPLGHVFGLDRDSAMVEEANQRSRQAGLQDRVSHHAGDATMLPYPDDFFDSCHCERVLMHVEDSGRVAAEMNRVLKPGGWLVLVEPDWGTLSIATKHTEVERRLARIRAERFLVNGYAGRQLYRLMRQADFLETSIEIMPVWATEFSLARYLTAMDQVEALALADSLISQDELDDWRKDLQRSQEQGCFYASLNIVITAGRKALQDVPQSL